MHCFPRGMPAGCGDRDWRATFFPGNRSSALDPELVCHVLIMESEPCYERQDSVPWPRQRPEARKYLGYLFNLVYLLFPWLQA